MDTSNNPKVKAAQFQKGNQQAKKRGQNKLTRDLKNGIIDAAVTVGSDGKGKGGLVGYLTMLARKYPKAYSSLLARVLPLQVSGGVGIGIIDAVNIVSVPGARYLAPEDVARMLQPPIEGEIVESFTGPSEEEAEVIPIRQ